MREAQIEVREQAHALDEAGSQAERVVRLVLDQAADAADALVRRELLQVGPDRGAALERRVGDQRLDARVGAREPVDIRRLLEVLPGIDGDLDPHQRLDLARAALVIELRHQARPVEHRLAAHPAIGDHARVVEVHVGVDDREIGHGGRLTAAPRRRRRALRRRRECRRSWPRSAGSPRRAAGAPAPLPSRPGRRRAWPRARGACPGIPG